MLGERFSTSDIGLDLLDSFLYPPLAGLIYLQNDDTVLFAKDRYAHSMPADRHGGIGDDLFPEYCMKINEKLPANVVNVNFRGHLDVDHVNNICALYMVTLFVI